MYVGGANGIKSDFCCGSDWTGANVEGLNGAVPDNPDTPDIPDIPGTMGEMEGIELDCIGEDATPT